MDSNTKSKVIKGLKWSSIESFATTILQFFIGIIIARRLMPADYGILGMLAIFMGISSIFLDSGFGNALIQKKEVSQADYSTAFFFNSGVALLLYLILFACAPLIADFYNQPLLIPVTRVYTLTLIINGLTISQSIRFTRDLDFKSKARFSIISLISSGTIGIVLAYTGFGVWALVMQGIVGAIANSGLLWFYGRWTPSLIFSKESFKALFGFGGKILGSSLINTIYNNLSTLIIGKAFKATELGFFTRARSYSSLPGDIITRITMKVNYPVLSRYQDDDEQLMANYRTLLRAPVYLLYPIIFGMACLAGPLIYTMLGEKWMGCVPMMIILGFGYLWDPLTYINLNLLYVKGRTDLVLKLELIKKPIAFLMLFCAIPFGIYGMCASVSLYGFVAFCFNCYYTGKILKYGFFKQVKELLPILGNCILMSSLVILSTLWIPNQLLKLIVGIIVGVVIYFALSFISKDSTFMSLFNRAKVKFPILKHLKLKF